MPMSSAGAHTSLPLSPGERGMYDSHYSYLIALCKVGYRVYKVCINALLLQFSIEYAVPEAP
jgi:hypothetical protein